MDWGVKDMREGKKSRPLVITKNKPPGKGKGVKWKTRQRRHLD